MAAYPRDSHPWDGSNRLIWRTSCSAYHWVDCSCRNCSRNPSKWLHTKSYAWHSDSPLRQNEASPEPSGSHIHWQFHSPLKYRAAKKEVIMKLQLKRPPRKPTHIDNLFRLQYFGIGSVVSKGLKNSNGQQFLILNQIEFIVDHLDLLISFPSSEIGQLSQGEDSLFPGHKLSLILRQDIEGFSSFQKFPIEEKLHPSKRRMVVQEPPKSCLIPPETLKQILLLILPQMPIDRKLREFHILEFLNVLLQLRLIPRSIANRHENLKIHVFLCQLGGQLKLLILHERIDEISSLGLILLQEDCVLLFVAIALQEIPPSIQNKIRQLHQLMVMLLPQFWLSSSSCTVFQRQTDHFQESISYPILPTHCRPGKPLVETWLGFWEGKERSLDLSEFDNVLNGSLRGTKKVAFAIETILWLLPKNYFRPRPFNFSQLLRPSRKIFFHIYYWLELNTPWVTQSRNFGLDTDRNDPQNF